ncbi:hypothetical protein CAEBREN_11467 [Caenorhabditis brenneri]|uniref:Sdz-33 F-box domain-containing protein n=1 Tax=Caenorhabditis brenneri TaxID=135651 RepID=G0MQJ2_CAEBE|nr:hypothetical protein CAEBREN_11467 [Caenorhabditis brenneri]
MTKDPVKKMNVPFNSRNATALTMMMFSSKPDFNDSSKSRQDHKMEEYRKIINNFVCIFVIESVSFTLANATFHAAYSYIEHARRVGLKFECVEIELLRDKKGDYQKLLTLCSDASELSVDVNYRRNFTFDGFDQFNMDYLSIHALHNIKWLTVDNICALLNCSRLSVDVNWRDKDFNQFLKFLMKSDGRLTWLTFYNNREINPQVVLNGINSIVRVRNEVFEIQRANGVRIKVTYEWFHRKLEVSNI